MVSLPQLIDVDYVRVQGLVLQEDGKILVSATVGSTGSSTSSLQVVRYLTTGLVDTAFGSGGSSLISGEISSIHGLGLSPGGKILVGLSGAVVPGADTDDFGVARLYGDVSEDLPSLSIDDQSLTAQSSGTQNAVFHVTLSQAWPEEVTVVYQTLEGTAKQGIDYTPQTGTITFAAGSISQTITIPVLGNLFVAPEKLFAVQLSNPTGATVARGAGQGAIFSDASPSWHNSVSPMDVNADGVVTALDVIRVINYLNDIGSGELGAAPFGQHLFYDVDNDGSALPLDALLIINFLNDNSGDQIATATSTELPTAGDVVTDAPSSAPLHAFDEVMFTASMANSSPAVGTAQAVGAIVSVPTSQPSQTQVTMAENSDDIEVKVTKVSLSASDEQTCFLDDESLEETLSLLISN
jgi:hypothetical protein